MARANLILDEAVRSAFFSAQEDQSIRILKVTIAQELLTLHSSLSSTGSADVDFDNLLPQNISDTDACLILFRLNEATLSNKWLLLAWVPDGCRVRDKMLYSSSREDLKRSLGIGYFTAEYAANTRTDIKWSLLLDHLDKDQAKVYSDMEVLAKEEQALTHLESSNVKSAALGLLPFEVSPSATGNFSTFLAADSACNWIEIAIVKEKIEVLSHANVSYSSSLTSYVNSEEARFYITRLTNEGKSIVFFIFSCPENAPVKMKMTMSSSKATVIAAAKDHGIVCDKTVEIRSADEIDDIIKAELNPEQTPNGGPSSAAANISHSKPQRPGRGKASIKKFVADDDI